MQKQLLTGKLVSKSLRLAIPQMLLLYQNAMAAAGEEKDLLGGKC